MPKSLQSTSKFLSLILRHEPQAIGLTLDQHGWAELETLIALVNANGTQISLALILEVVATSDKQRFVVSPDGKKIRANQGHSVSIDLNLPPQKPPVQLFHGTASRFVQSIRENGLVPGSRQHVHLSVIEATAIQVGSRHGNPVVLIVKSLEMHSDQYDFFLSENGVWLTSNVPARYLVFPGEAVQPYTTVQ